MVGTMSLIKKRMSTSDTILLICAVLTFVISFVTLALSDNVKSLIGTAKITATDDSINLLELASVDGYLNIFKLTNVGSNPAEDIKIVIDFSSEITNYEIYSDEEYTSKSVNDGDLRISFDRLSTNSELKILTYSKELSGFNAYYIDNSGKYEINHNLINTSQSLLDILLLTIVVLSLLIIVWMYKKISESTLIETLESHQTEIQKGIREMRDEIGNIEIVVEDRPRSDSSSGFGKTISDLMAKM